MPSEILRENSKPLVEKTGWVISLYEPVIHFADFGKDVLKISIVRNPLDVITINVERHFKGFLGRQIFGTDLQDINSNILDEKKSLTSFDKKFIDHQILRYNSFLDCLDKNINNTMCFKYEQIINDTSICLKNVLNFYSFDYSELEKSGRLTLNYTGTIGFHPFSEKIKEYLLDKPHFDQKYKHMIEKIYDKQSKYNYQFIS